MTPHIEERDDSRADALEEIRKRVEAYLLPPGHQATQSDVSVLLSMIAELTEENARLQSSRNDILEEAAKVVGDYRASYDFNSVAYTALQLAEEHIHSMRMRTPAERATARNNKDTP